MLNKLVSPKSTKKSKMIGRGMGSGVGGHTVGRGLSGATARTGYQYPRKNFEGGQNPLSKRLPRYRGDVRGITRAFFTANHKNVPIKLSRVEQLAKEIGNKDITLELLVESGLFKAKYNKTLKVKILLDKDVTTKFNIKGIPVSKSVQASIEKMGGEVTL